LYTSDYRRGRKDRIRDRDSLSEWVRVSARFRFRVRVRVRAGETNTKTAATNQQYKVGGTGFN
jgi:hypothetical protein